METNRAIFLDRDGVINIDEGYTHRIEDFSLIDGAASAIRRANTAGFKVMVVTNQGGIGLGYYDHADVRSFHAHMQAVLEREAAIITDIAYCPHHPRSPDPGLRDCTCRKPSPEMLLTLASRHNIDLAASAMIGDRDTDVAAGTAAGAHAFLFNGGSLDTLMIEVLDHLAAPGESEQ